MSLLLGNRAWAPALLVVPAALVLSVLLLHQDAALWRADAGWAWVNWSTQALVLAPLLGAATAWSTAQVLAHGRGDWTAATRRGPVYAVLPMVTGVATGLAVLLLTAVLVALLRDGPGDDGAWFLPALATALCSVVTCVALGALAARIWPHPLVAGIVLVLEWGVSAGLVDAFGLGGLLGLEGASIPLAGYEFRLDLLANRAVVALLLLGLAVVVVVPRRWSARSAPRRGLAVALTLAVPFALYAPGLFAATPDVQSDPAVTASSCQDAPDGGVTVCVMPGGEDALPDLVRGFGELDDARAALGLARLGEFRQRTPGEHFRRLDGSLRVSPEERASTFEVPTAGSAALPAAVSLTVQPECADGREEDEPEHWVEALVVLGWWTATSVGDGSAVDEYVIPGDPIIARFEELGADARADYLRAALTAAGTCDLSAVPLLRAA
ncbi:hypothetical protein [Promicromonospora sp. NPDC057488]|uniref:hypothetical protein n=1 Tax=Promicromonospora sp. NPDC057488 TaxID=3346147 RepID=UPI00366B0FD9